MKLGLIGFMTSILLAGALGFWLGTHSQRIRSLKFAPIARAQDRLDVPSRAVPCAAGLLQGAYAFTVQGKGPSNDEDYATVGIINFDGRGGLSLSNTQSINGRIIPPTPIAGLYILNENCGGRITLTTGSIFDAVVSNNGREVYLIQVNSGNVISGFARKL